MKCCLYILIIAGVLIASASLGQQWTSITTLPDGYQEHCLVYANGFLYNIGGVSQHNGALDGTNVFYSQVYSNGTIGSWNHTTSLPLPVVDGAAVVGDGFIYVLGGNTYTFSTGEYTLDTVYYARINADGTLGVWQTANPLPVPVFWEAASVWNHILYTSGGANEVLFGLNSVNAASIRADGSLSAWVAQAPLPAAVCAQCQIADGAVYVLGGYYGDAATTVYTSQVNPDGTLVGWIETRSMPQTLANFAVVTGAGKVFTVAGYNNTSQVNSCYNATLAGDGSLLNWTNGPSLPQGLLYHAAAAGGGYIFVSGGATGDDASGAVYSMPLPPPPVLPILSSQLTSSNQFQVKLNSSTNTGFGFMASSDLMNWTKVGWGFTDTNGFLSFQDTNSPAFPFRFYKAYWPLP